MAPIEVIAFDADDTLWHNEILYSQAKDKFSQLFSDYHDPEWIGKKLDETEMRNIYSYGYGIKSFTLSMIETAIEITEGQVAGREVQEIISLAKEMLQAGVQLLEQAEETLAELSSTHVLMLITKGDTFEQERKIKRSGLASYFRHSEIVSEKTMQVYQELLEKYDLDPQRFLMVGNSMRSDIIPVIGIGGQAVFISHPLTWVHETMIDRSIEVSEYFELEHLGQLPDFVRSLDDR